MDTNMTPINDSEIHPQLKQQMNFMNDEDDGDNNHEFYSKMQHQHAPSQVPQFQQQQIYPFQGVDKKDVFANMDKTAYIVIFIAFILGFFMGKTMQPVILRHS